MLTNFDGTSGDLQLNKNKEDINKKNKEKTSNEEQISEKKNK